MTSKTRSPGSYTEQIRICRRNKNGPMHTNNLCNSNELDAIIGVNILSQCLDGRGVFVLASLIENSELACTNLTCPAEITIYSSILDLNLVLIFKINYFTVVDCCTFINVRDLKLPRFVPMRFAEGRYHLKD